MGKDKAKGQTYLNYLVPPRYGDSNGFQAGSTFKPFALAAATEQEIPLNSVWPGDSPTTVDGYTFANYGDKSYGPVTLLLESHGR